MGVFPSRLAAVISMLAAVAGLIRAQTGVALDLVHWHPVVVLCPLGMIALGGVVPASTPAASLSRKTSLPRHENPVGPSAALDRAWLDLGERVQPPRASKTGAHRHQARPPHGGTAVALGCDAFHVEFARDAVPGALAAYVLDRRDGGVCASRLAKLHG